MLRHTHATALIRAGVPIEVVARLLTHRSSTTTSSTYVHLDAADIRAALADAGVFPATTRRSPDEHHRPPTTARRAAGHDLADSMPWRRRSPLTAGMPASSACPPTAAERSTTFEAIVQPWLRDATKRWCRWRLATGSAYGTISASALAMSRLSAYLAARCPDRRARRHRPATDRGLHLLAHRHPPVGQLPRPSR